jgi:4-hydroxybenzoyl-CoA thioesterase
MTAPYLHHRVITWGDTDAAQIVYTVRFFDFAMEAIEGWFRAVLGLDWYTLNIDQHIGTPFVNVSMDISTPLTPRDRLCCAVHVERLGRASLTLRVLGRKEDGTETFDARHTCCFVNSQSMTAIPVPPEFRTTIEAYCGAGGGIAPRAPRREAAGA